MDGCAKSNVIIEMQRKCRLILMHVDTLSESPHLRVANAEARFQIMLNRLGIGVFRANAAGRVIQANAALLRMLDVSTVDQILEVDLRGLHLHQHEPSSRPVEGEGASAPRASDVEIRKHNGAKMCIAISKTHVVNPEGESFIDGMIEEKTEQKRAERLMASKAESLARSNGDLEQFARVVSHDLQEPLRMISVYLDLLSMRHGNTLCPEGQEYLNNALNASVRMRLLIKDILKYSLIGDGQAVGSEIDSGDVFNEVITSLKPLIDELNATIVYTSLPQICINKAHLVQLFQNLLSNALKFHGPEPPHIRVEAKRDGPEWIFSVSDNGIGIDPKYHQRVFELFRRLPNTSAYPGTGIGLSSCKRIVERSDGRIWITSVLGHGTTFHFSLPAVCQADASEGSTDGRIQQYGDLDLLSPNHHSRHSQGPGSTGVRPLQQQPTRGANLKIAP